MGSRGRDPAKGNRNDTLPNSLATRYRCETVILVDELSKAANAIRGSRPTELAVLEKIADHVIAAGYHCMGDLMDTSAFERPQSYKLLSDARPSWARAMRKLLEPQAPPAEFEAKKMTSYEEIDIPAALDARKWPAGVGHILRPQQEAVNLF